MLGMMGNVVRRARPPPLPQTASGSVGVSGATPESGRRVEEGKRAKPEGRGEEGFKTPAPGKKKKKKVEVFSFLPSHFENFGGRPRRGNVTQTSLSEIESLPLFLLGISQDPVLTPRRDSGEPSAGLSGSDN